MTNEYVRLPDAANLLCVSPHTLRKWVQQNRIAAHKAGRVLLFRVVDVQAIIQKRKQS